MVLLVPALLVCVLATALQAAATITGVLVTNSTTDNVAVSAAGIGATNLAVTIVRNGDQINIFVLSDDQAENPYGVKLTAAPVATVLVSEANVVSDSSSVLFDPSYDAPSTVPKNDEIEIQSFLLFETFDNGPIQWTATGLVTGQDYHVVALGFSLFQTGVSGGVRARSETFTVIP